MSVAYPDEYDTPTFPAGKHIAVSRMFALTIVSVLLLVVFACGALLWAQKSVRVHPFLVSVDEVTGDWNVVGHYHDEIKELPAMRSLQESVIGKFMRNWFSISSDAAENALIWADCDNPDTCQTMDSFGNTAQPCALYCVSGTDIFEQFRKNIVPEYQQRYANNEYWQLDMSSLQIKPIGEITQDGAMWQIRATVDTNNGPIYILAYARIAYNSYSADDKNMGYYVQDFNAYRIEK